MYLEGNTMSAMYSTSKPLIWQSFCKPITTLIIYLILQLQRSVVRHTELVMQDDNQKHPLVDARFEIT